MLDRRQYTRYKTYLKGKAATVKGYSFPVEILDLSIEGAKLKTDKDIPVENGEIIYLAIQWKSSIKAETEVRWIKQEKFNTQFGVKFIKMPIEDKEAFRTYISDYALTQTSDVYFR